MSGQDWDEEAALLDLWDKGICPACGVRIPGGSRIGAGSKKDGGFCSLDCYAKYWKQELLERARSRSEATTKLSKQGHH